MGTWRILLCFHDKIVTHVHTPPQRFWTDKTIQSSSASFADLFVVLVLLVVLSLGLQAKLYFSLSSACVRVCVYVWSGQWWVFRDKTLGKSLSHVSVTIRKCALKCRKTETPKSYRSSSAVWLSLSPVFYTLSLSVIHFVVVFLHSAYFENFY